MKNHTNFSNNQNQEFNFKIQKDFQDFVVAEFWEFTQMMMMWSACVQMNKCLCILCVCVCVIVMSIMVWCSCKNYLSHTQNVLCCCCSSICLLSCFAVYMCWIGVFVSVCVCEKNRSFCVDIFTLENFTSYFFSVHVCVGLHFILFLLLLLLLHIYIDR